jgi:hypothetical protein
MNHLGSDSNDYFEWTKHFQFSFHSRKPAKIEIVAGVKKPVMERQWLHQGLASPANLQTSVAKSFPRLEPPTGVRCPPWQPMPSSLVRYPVLVPCHQIQPGRV